MTRRVRRYPRFIALLREARNQAGSMAAVARQIGISTSRYARAMGGEYTFDVLTCLRFAAVTGVPPLAVLRAAGKDEVADLLAHFFEGHDTDPQRLTAAQQQLLADWAGLDPQVRDGITTLIHQVARAKPPDDDSTNS